MRTLSASLVVLLLFPVCLHAQSSRGVEFQSATSLRDAVAGAAQASSRMAVHTGADRGGYSYIVVRRDQSGEVEVHDRLDDVFVVQEGAGTLRYGGSVSGSRETGPGEKRGGQIADGTTKRISVGDIVIVPAGIPHRVEVDAGASITYVVVKVTTVPDARAP
jgi:mannose-6-phosphate isomerase-like protein (cupin superfamily)